MKTYDVVYVKRDKQKYLKEDVRKGMVGIIIDPDSPEDIIRYNGDWEIDFFDFFNTGEYPIRTVHENDLGVVIHADKKMDSVIKENDRVELLCSRNILPSGTRGTAIKKNGDQWLVRFDRLPEKTPLDIEKADVFTAGNKKDFKHGDKIEFCSEKYYSSIPPTVLTGNVCFPLSNGWELFIEASNFGKFEPVQMLVEKGHLHRCRNFKVNDKIIMTVEEEKYVKDGVHVGMKGRVVAKPSDDEVLVEFEACEKDGDIEGLKKSVTILADEKDLYQAE